MVVATAQLLSGKSDGGCVRAVVLRHAAHTSQPTGAPRQDPCTPWFMYTHDMPS